MIRTLTTSIFLVVSVLCCRASAGEAEAYLKYFNFYVGEWSVTAEGDDEVSGTWVLKMSPTQCSHDSLLKVGDNVTHTVYGYNPVRKTWTGVGYSTGGNRWMESVKKKDADAVQVGDVFDYSGREIAPDGKVTTYKMRLTVVDRNTIRVVQRIAPAEGDSEETVRTLVGKRNK